MSQTRRKHRENSDADKRAKATEVLLVAEVLEALAGEALAKEREKQAAATAAAEQEALIADTQEADTQEADKRPNEGFQLKRTVESLLFASDRPIPTAQIRHFLGRSVDRNELQQCLDDLVEEYSTRGIVLHDVAGGYQFRTHPASSKWIQKLIAGRPVRLSRAQLDTLAIIAYRQPITRPEIDEIRGVDSGSTLKILLDRNLLRILGKKEEVGRPLLYGTSREFLEFFNLSDLRDLPTLREFQELNDDGMAQVDKLGADINGVDVGAVAAEVAAERAAARVASEAIEAALADERRLKREAGKSSVVAKDAAEPSSENATWSSREDAPELPEESADEETAQEPSMVGRDKDTTISDVDASEDETEVRAHELADELADATETGPNLSGDTADPKEDRTRLDLSPAPEGDPDTITEEGPDATSTEISAVDPDLTIVDRQAAPDYQEGADNTILESSTLDNAIPESTLTEPTPRGLDAIDDLTIVPNDSKD